MDGGFMNKTMDRRSALAVLGSVGLGLASIKRSPLFAAELGSDSWTRLFPRLSEKSRGTLSRLLQDRDFSGRLPAAAVTFIAADERTTVDALMIDLLPLARTYSRPPISNYQVGVLARGLSGDLYLGANIEIPGHALGFSVHGEQSALSSSYMHSEKGIAAIALTAAPCGHCRQFMNEMSPSGDIQVLIAGSAPMKLSMLLPMAFGPKDLGFKDGALPVREANIVRPKGALDDLTVAAWEAARRSYAPYSKSHSGIAIRTRGGRIFSGAYIENVAFNPSLSPLQTALVALILAGESNTSISKVILVETTDAAISQKSVTQAVLAALAPTAELQLVTTTMAA